MNDVVITLKNSELSLDQPVMIQKSQCLFWLQFATMVVK
ncbi:hypothetical protein SAMN05216167_108205 [Spirosoma endophyticum]|uniref:Uncharacterized protein n=1 Tax=Spirosoma endophyticum TaxID=662367 RepID=A0A1I1WAT5_9BACT|nr:hypothetical protein SAMN05216167_108205 [Spirosoma endophyticum]